MHIAHSEVRRRQRILVPPERRTQTEGGERVQMEGLVTAIGLGGMFVRTRCGPPRGATL
jgi:hypothetical protein